MYHNGDIGLSESSVRLNPLARHHSPYKSSHLGIYPCAETHPINYHSKLVVYPMKYPNYPMKDHSYPIQSHSIPFIPIISSHIWGYLQCGAPFTIDNRDLW